MEQEMQSQSMEQSQSFDFSNDFKVLEQPQTQQLPEKVGDWKLDEYNQILQKGLGEGYSYTRIKQLEEAEKRAQELEMSYKKIAERKLAPLAEKINDLYERGASDQEINHFLEMQKIDPAKMSNLDKLRMLVKSENPEFTPEEVDAILEEELGELPTDEENLSPKTSALLKKKAKEAEQKIADMKVRAGEPENVRKAREQEAQMKNLHLAWEDAAPKLTPKEIEVGGNKMPLSQDMQKVYMGFLQQRGAQLSMESLGKKGKAYSDEIAKTLAEEGKRYMMYHFGEQMIAKAVEDAKKNTQSAINRSFAGYPPISDVKQDKNAPESSKDGLEAIKKDLRYW